MPNVTFEGPEGEQSAPFVTGDTLMTVAVRNLVVGIEAQCGGSCACGTCLVFLAAGASAFPLPGSDESDMLDAVADGAEGGRLSCQLVLTDAHDGLIVKVPDL